MNRCPFLGRRIIDPATKGMTVGFDDLVDKGKDLASEHEEKVTEGIDKAKDIADEKTEGKYSEHTEMGAEKAKDYVEGLDEK